MLEVKHSDVLEMSSPFKFCFVTSVCFSKTHINRVSHIKLDRVNGSKLRFGGQIRKFN